ncbi:tautomerase family protein [Shimia sp.]|uniref:tautomerase family protein n=1 Tax=Shimia sp. TaxID=1954381 RepID=UPI003BADAB25
MPLYMCNAVHGVISAHAKKRIAEDITDIHCDVTRAPRAFVHAFFFEDAPQLAIDGKAVFLFASIREGHSEAQKAALVSRITASIHAHVGIDMSQIVMDITDVPASWVMEGGEILPEPGEEGDWIKRRHPVGV